MTQVSVRIILRQFLKKIRVYFVYLKVICFRSSFREKGLNDYVKFAFKYLNKPIPFWQIPEEIELFMHLVKNKSPKYVLEIGTAGGGSLFLLSKMSSNDAIIISIDLPKGQFGGGYPEERAFLYNSFAKKKQKIHLIKGDSHDKESLNKVKNVLKNEKIDCIFIDGDHSYKGIRSDFEMYFPLLSETGIIGFHDIVRGSFDKVGEVPRFWTEIKDKFNYVEFIKDMNQGGYGIGVIYAQ